MSTSIGFTGLLTLLFIALKLLHVIDWEWVWVLSPLWISFLIGLVVMVFFVVGLIIAVFKR